MKLKALLFVLLLLSAPSVHAATIRGTIYEWTTLEPAPNTIVAVDSNPPQTYVSKDGTYSFDIPAGEYVLSAVHYTRNKPDAAVNETITITSEGEFTMDLILFPVTEIEPGFEDSDFEISNPYADDVGIEYAAFFALGLIITVVYVFRKQIRGKLKSRHAKKKIAEASSAGNGISKELKQVVAVLKKNGGRMTQKDIRREFPLSEAKVSLMITELESLGIVRRIKTGRANVVVFSSKS